MVLNPYFAMCQNLRAMARKFWTKKSNLGLYKMCNASQYTYSHEPGLCIQMGISIACTIDRSITCAIDLLIVHAIDRAIFNVIDGSIACTID